MKINITYFAILQDERGLASETVDTEALTPADLYAELKESYSFVKEKYVLTPEDVDDYWTGREAFFKLVEKQKILLLDHLIKPEELGL